MADNLKDLQREVIQVSADIGFGFDGDGDRVGFIDETGTHHEADMLLLLLSRRFLNRHPGEKILIDVKCSDRDLGRSPDTDRHWPYTHKTSYARRRCSFGWRS